VTTTSVLHNLAWLRAQRGEEEAAVAGYRAAVALDPDFSEAQLDLALLLEKRGRHREALEHL
jgi:Flp pilus assembly protein TadD